MGECCKGISMIFLFGPPLIEFTSELYNQLLRIAAHHSRWLKLEQGFDATDFVNEACFKLWSNPRIEFTEKTHSWEPRSA